MPRPLLVLVIIVPPLNMKDGYLLFLFLILLSIRHSVSDLGPKVDDDSYCHDVSCPENENKELLKRGPTSLTGLIGKAFQYVGEAAYNTIYKLSEDVLKDIADIVRGVFSEEAFNIVSSAGKSALNILFDTGNNRNEYYKLAVLSFLSQIRFLQVLELQYSQSLFS